MLKRFFSKPAVSRVEEKLFFFLVLYLGIMRLKITTSPVHDANYVGREKILKNFRR